MKNFTITHKTAINNFGDFESFQDTFEYDPKKEVLRANIEKHVEEYLKIRKIKYCTGPWDNEPDFKLDRK